MTEEMQAGCLGRQIREWKRVNAPFLLGLSNIHFINFLVAWIFVGVVLVGGSLIFSAIENDRDRRDIRAHVNDYKSLIETLDEMEDDKVESDIEFVFEWMVDHGDCTIPHRNHPNWDFTSAMYLVFQLISTIGYGVFAPITPGGRCFATLLVLAFLPLFNYA